MTPSQALHTDPVPSRVQTRSNLVRGRIPAASFADTIARSGSEAGIPSAVTTSTPHFAAWYCLAQHLACTGRSWSRLMGSPGTIVQAQTGHTTSGQATWLTRPSGRNTRFWPGLTETRQTAQRGRSFVISHELSNRGDCTSSRSFSEGPLRAFPDGR